MATIEHPPGNRGRCHRILVVEDEYLIADDVRASLEQVGIQIIGPVATEKEALELIDKVPFDCAVLDICLRGQVSFEIAHALHRLGIPFVFATGYGPSFIPSQFASVKLLEKPFKSDALIALIAGL